MASETRKKLTMAVKILPYWKTVGSSPISGGRENMSESKFGLPTSQAMSGLMKLSTRPLTTRPNAAPMTTPTARSTTLPRAMKVLNPDSILNFLIDKGAAIVGGLPSVQVTVHVTITAPVVKSHGLQRHG